MAGHHQGYNVSLHHLQAAPQSPRHSRQLKTPSYGRSPTPQQPPTGTDRAMPRRLPPQDLKPPWTPGSWHLAPPLWVRPAEQRRSGEASVVNGRRLPRHHSTAPKPPKPPWLTAVRFPCTFMTRTGTASGTWAPRAECERGASSHDTEFRRGIPGVTRARRS